MIYCAIMRVETWSLQQDTALRRDRCACTVFSRVSPLARLYFVVCMTSPCPGCCHRVPHSLDSISNSFVECAKVLRGDLPPRFSTGVFPQPEAITCIRETVMHHDLLWRCFARTTTGTGAAAAAAGVLVAWTAYRSIL